MNSPHLESTDNILLHSPCYLKDVTFNKMSSSLMFEKMALLRVTEQFRWRCLKLGGNARDVCVGAGI